MLRCLQHIGKRERPLALADELDEVGDAPLLCCKPGALLAAEPIWPTPLPVSPPPSGGHHR